ncbi:MAG: hypothetical protein ACPGSD_15650 [Flavobacteriales bacterium]
MKNYFILFLLVPFISFGQNEIKVIVNEHVISETSECPFYAEFDNQKINLLDSNLFQILMVQDSFFISGAFDSIYFKSNSLKLMRKVKDSIMVKLDTELNETEVYFYSGSLTDYKKIEIVTMRDHCYYYVQSNSEGISKLVQCIIGPAYFIEGKAIFDEDPKENRKRKKRFKKKNLALRNKMKD